MSEPTEPTEPTGTSTGEVKPASPTHASDAGTPPDGDAPETATASDGDVPDDGAATETDTSGSATATRRDRVVRWVGGGVLVAGLAGLGMVGYTQFVADDDTVAGMPTMASWTDEETGLSLDLPEDWNRLDATNEQVRLIATPNNRDSLLVRAVDLSIEVEANQIDGVRQFTQDLVTEGTDVEIVTGPQRVELAGLPGWYYLYRFEDPASGDVGVHSHYFLFDGDRMIVLVFQALPETRFADLAPTFDAIATSFRVTG